MGRQTISCTLDGRDLTNRVRWEDSHGHAFCSLAELEVWESGQPYQLELPVTPEMLWWPASAPADRRAG